MTTPVSTVVAIAARIAPRITAWQHHVLREAAAGHLVYDGSNPDHIRNHDGHGHTVSVRTIRCLVAPELIQIGYPDAEWKRTWQLTDLGREVLARLAVPDGAP